MILRQGKDMWIRTLLVLLVVACLTPVSLHAKTCHCTVEKQHSKKIKKKKAKKKKEEKKEKSNTPVWPVSGLYMTKDAKSLGPISCNCWFNDIKYRGWLDGYIIHNFNHPDPDTVNQFQYLSVIKGRDITIEGRVFDVHSDEPTFNLAEIELERIPERCVLGAKLDLAIGDTQDILADTIAGSFGFDSAAARNVKDLRYIQHISVSYIFPICKGLRVDFGKFVTHIGGESIETVKNWNYSHSFYNTYGIPAQETGFHFNYPWSDTFYTDFYVLNGWNCAFVDNNNGKTWGPTIGWTPTKTVSIVLNYLEGPEQNNNDSNIRRLFDAYATFGPYCKHWLFMVNVGFGRDENAVNNTEDAEWSGIMGYIRYKINDQYEPAFRIEYYTDPDGFTTNVPQSVTDYTLTLNIKLVGGPCKSTLVLLRPELRYDHSNSLFFTEDDHFRNKHSQWTLGMGLSWIM